MSNQDQRTQVVILDTIREGLVIGHVKPDEQGMAFIGIIFWETVDTFFPTIQICNFDHPVQWIEDGAYSVTVYDPIPNDPTRFTPRHLEIYAWALARKEADPYMIRFAFDGTTGTFYLKERMERG